MNYGSQINVASSIVGHAGVCARLQFSLVKACVFGVPVWEDVWGAARAEEIVKKDCDRRHLNGRG